MKTLQKPETGTDEKPGFQKFRITKILDWNASKDEIAKEIVAGYHVKLRNDETGAVIIHNSSQAVIDLFYPVMPVYARCGCCGRTLSDPESVARGIGPECLKKQA
jgi:hypothetical protein